MHAGEAFEFYNGSKVQEAVIADASGYAIGVARGGHGRAFALPSKPSLLYLTWTCNVSMASTRPRQ